MSEVKTLHLTLKKKWFDMIASGEKKEEYRELKKYWGDRFANGVTSYLSSFCKGGIGYQVHWKSYDVIEFRHGYAKDAPKIRVQFKGFEIDKGKTKWGAEKGKEYFILKLGKILSHE
jgi:hypothetical protein